VTGPTSDSEASNRQTAMEVELAELRAENDRFRRLLGLEARAGESGETRSDNRHAEPAVVQADVESAAKPRRVTQSSTSREKIALFRSLFAGRDDVHALAWSSQRSGKSGWSPSVRGGVANAKAPDREYLPYTEEVLEQHLAGEVHVGIYPLLHGDTCQLLACDFDGPGWTLDTSAYFDVARAMGIPALQERSRSGDGGHVWIFFAGPVAASSARRLGVHLIREAMTVRAEIDLASYDRLFPTQDFMPKGSFGNLIALPLQGTWRKRGTTVFLDPSTMEPYADQWEQLSSIEPVEVEFLAELVDGMGDLETGPDAHPHRRRALEALPDQPPGIINARAGAMLSIDRVGGLPP